MKRPLAFLAVLVAVAGAALLWLQHSGRQVPFFRKAKAPPPAGAAGDPSGRTRPEREAVDRARRDGLRPAEDVDAIDSETRQDLSDLYVDYHPFFVRGDLNGDGRLDFVQAFVRKGGGEPRLDVAVFFGREDGTFGEPVWVERAVDLAAGDLAVDRSLVVVTPDLEAEEVRRWRWEGSEGRFVDADADLRPGESGNEAPDDEPGDRPRAKV